MPLGCDYKTRSCLPYIIMVAILVHTVFPWDGGGAYRDELAKSRRFRFGFDTASSWCAPDPSSFDALSLLVFLRR